MRPLGRARLVALALVVALLGAACVEPLPEGAEETTTTSEATPTPSPTDPVVPENPRPDLPPGVAEVLAEIGGRWAIGRGHEVVVLDLADLSEVTVDGSTDVVATQPTWSNDGSLLAWSVTDLTEPTAPFQVRRGDGGDPWSADSLYPSAVVSAPPFYLQWGGNGDLLTLGGAGLDEPVGPVALRYIDPAGGATAIGFGGPIWVDWSPEGTRALVHWDDAAVGVFDPTVGAAIESVLDTAHLFGPAVWLDDSQFLAAADGGLVTMSTAEPGPATELIGADRLNVFVANADGTRIAFRHWLDTERSEGDGRSASDAPLRVLDVADGELTEVTDVPVLAWEWSPDGTRLAYLADARAEGIQTVAWRQESRPADEPDADPADDGAAEGGETPEAEPFDATQELRWHFWADDVLVNATSPFVVTDVEAAAYLPFFDQYALSHTRWSPEGDAFVFAGSVTDDLGAVRTGVHVQFVEFLTDSVWITDGDVAFWSPTGGGGGGTSPF